MKLADKISHLCHERGTTLGAVCRSAGLKYQTLHAQIRNGRPIPFETLDALAGQFGVPLDHFSARKSLLAVQSNDNDLLNERAARIYTDALRSAQVQLVREGFSFGTDQILDWLNRNGGRLDEFEQLEERVDLYEPIRPEDHMIRPAKLGANSLASKFFDIKSVDDFINKISKFDKNFLESVVVSHIEASKTSYVVSDVDLAVIVGDRQICTKYRRVMAPVKDSKGNCFTLVHAKVI